MGLVAALGLSWRQSKAITRIVGLSRKMGLKPVLVGGVRNAIPSSQCLENASNLVNTDEREFVR